MTAHERWPAHNVKALPSRPRRLGNRVTIGSRLALKRLSYFISIWYTNFWAINVNITFVE